MKIFAKLCKTKPHLCNIYNTLHYLTGNLLVQDKLRDSGNEQAVNNFPSKRKPNIEFKGNCVLNALLFFSAPEVHSLIKH